MNVIKAIVRSEPAWALAISVAIFLLAPPLDREVVILPPGGVLGGTPTVNPAVLGGVALAALVAIAVVAFMDRRSGRV